MLDRIRFRGFDLHGTSLYIDQDDKSDGGKFSLKFSEHRVVPQKDDNGNWIFIDIKSRLLGYPHSETEVDGNDGTLFRAEAALALTFECNFDEKVPDDFYNENAWFFEGYVYLCSKIVFERMLKDTVLENITLPWSPNFSEK